ncbi:MAG: sulfatase-like hydrolase/transferase [Bryobacteraceae bacterium]
MNRRDLLRLTAGAAAAGTLLKGAKAPATPGAHFIEDRTGKGLYRQAGGAATPNVFLITADMVSPDFYLPSRPASREMHLPNIHSLMRDGVFFSNAFCTVPLCSPSRASYLTGRYSYILGNGERALDGLDSELRPTDIIWPEYLKASGYVARHTGKCHVGTQLFIKAFGENDHPWNRWSPPVYLDDGYLDYQRRLGIQPQKYSKEIVFLQQDRKTPGNSVGGWIEQRNGKPFPVEAQYSYYLMQRACGELEDLAISSKTNAKPIYYELDLFDPHQPLSVPDGFEKREREIRKWMGLPKTYEKVKARNWKPSEDQPNIYNIYRKYWGLYNPNSLLEYRIAYALQMELVDQVIGVYINKLKSLGLYENSLIIFNSDHGEMNGRWGIIDKGVFLYPDVVRAPLVMKSPANMEVRPRVEKAPVSLMDIGPTVLATAGIEPEARMDGRSLIPYLKNTVPPTDRELLFFGGWHVGVNFPCGIQHWNPDGSHYLYSYNCSSPVDELYDLNAVEAENLAQKPEHATLRRDMIRRLGAALQRDPRWTAYWSEFRVAKYFDLPKTAGGMQLVGH